MKERGVIFTGESVRGILAGRKTQTRRLCNPQPRDVLHVHGLDNGKFGYLQQTGFSIDDHAEHWLRVPYGIVGDRLWVRETWATLSGNGARVVYRADGIEDPRTGWDDVPPERRPKMRWAPSIYMPREWSRITLEITNLRVERLHDISAADILAEGVWARPCDCEACARTSIMCPAVESGLAFDFAVLWNSINRDRAPWSSNPWLWVVSFRKLSDEEAKKGRAA